MYILEIFNLQQKPFKSTIFVTFSHKMAVLQPHQLFYPLITPQKTHLLINQLQYLDKQRQSIESLTPSQIIISMISASITKIFITLQLIVIAEMINFPLTRSRETCLVITQGSYQIEYVVSGHSENKVRCLIQETNRVIHQIVNQSEFEGEFIVNEDEASICFSSLDTMSKAVSVDFLRTDDPLKGLIKDAEKLAIHGKLFKGFQELEKVYRDQHFFLERNYIHSIMLKQTEIVVIFFLLLKILIAFISSFFQLYFVKRILENSFTPLPTEQAFNT